jgi:hypothetical protein
VLYSAGIFSGISFKMQNGLPSQTYELSTIHGLPGSFQVATAKDPCNYEVNGVVPDIILVATSNESPNEEVDNNDPYQCDIMPSSSDEDETASITYLKKNQDPSLDYWEGVAFHKSYKALSNSLIWADHYYRGHKMMQIHVQKSNV